jgi:hypothetical protein
VPVRRDRGPVIWPPGQTGALGSWSGVGHVYAPYGSCSCLPPLFVNVTVPLLPWRLRSKHPNSNQSPKPMYSGQGRHNWAGRPGKRNLKKTSRTPPMPFLGGPRDSPAARGERSHETARYLLTRALLNVSARALSLLRTRVAVRTLRRIVPPVG